MERRRSILISLALVYALVLSACGGSATSPASLTTPADEPQSRPQSQAAASEPTGAPEAMREEPAAAGGAPDVLSTEADDSTAESAANAPRATDTPRPPSDGESGTDEPYDSTYFQNYGVNPFVEAEDDPLSTFAMDIDTASYSVMRRFVDDGNLPDPDSVRVEEYLNAFDYRYPQPAAGSNFAIYTETAPSLFGGRNYEMVQIGIQGRAIADEERRPTSLTFVIDVSGSMDREDRLETVKEALALLVEQLQPEDQVGIVTYGSEARSILPPTSGANKRRILNALSDLRPDGSTNVESGLDIGFAQADEAFVRQHSNMILLCSDGVANNGVTDPQALLDKYREYTSKGIKLSTFGFGMGNYNDVLMEQLADAGNGHYRYIDTLDEAEKVFVENLSGTLQLIARDAKIQVEFNPEVVSRYRLVGYENRDIADQDFRDDAVDAGEIGAGHSVTALYEIKRYADAEGPLGTVRVRYHRPDSRDNVLEEAQTIERDDQRDFEDASARFRLAVSVAEYAELLRHSRWERGNLLEEVVAMARDASRDFDEPAAAEFVQILNRAAALAPRE